MDGNIFDGVVAQPDEQLFGGGEETPSESPTEKPEVEETPKEAPGQAEDSVEEVPNDLDDKPLHKDSRFKRVIEERNRLREEKEAWLAERESKSKEDIKPTSTDLPAWYVKFFGDDASALQGFRQMTAEAKEAAKAEALAELEARETQAKETARAASDWVDEQVDALEESGEKFEKNALLAVMDKYRPTDLEGNLDFKAGLEILKLQAPGKKMDARKKLADSLNSKPGKTEPQKRDYVTAADLRKAGGWDSVYED